MARKRASNRGRPTKYRPEFSHIAYRHALLGASDKKIGLLLGVPDTTIHRWEAAHKEFRCALARGREEADNAVAKSLFGRAIGHKHKAVKIFYDSKTGEIVEAPYIERYPPDTAAIIFWLKNRQPELWKDKTAQEITGKNGGPIETKDVSLSALTDDELRSLKTMAQKVHVAPKA